jgi:hypothetical protein
MARFLIITPDDAIRIQKVKEYASKNLNDEKRVCGIKEGTIKPPGDNPNHVVHLFTKFRAVYTIDVLGEDLYHHISMSCNGKYVSVLEAEIILKEFGIADNIHDVDNVWIEKHMNAVNIIKKIEK